MGSKLLCVNGNKQVSVVRYASWIKSIFKPDKIEPPYGSHCVQIGDPVLRKKADGIPHDKLTSPEVKFLVRQLKSVLEDFKLVGLSAPQIGMGLRVFVMSFSEKAKEKYTPEVFKARDMSVFPFTVFINPELKVLNHTQVIFEEGCSSIAGFVAEVSRNQSVEVSAYDIDGKLKKYTFSGWNARIAQHEYDHLNGVLFTDIMIKKTLRNSNWQTINAKGGRVVLSYYSKK
jgi:peptide deformylase